MDDVVKNSTTKDMLDRGHNFAVLGLTIALFAFSLSVTSPWIINMLSPAIEVIDTEILEENTKHVQSIEERIARFFVPEKIEDEALEKYAAQKKDRDAWTDNWRLIVTVMALGGIINGALGLIRKEGRYIAGAAIFIGISAIIAQYVWLALILVVIMLLFVGILSSFGVSF